MRPITTHHHRKIPERIAIVYAALLPFSKRKYIKRSAMADDEREEQEVGPKTRVGAEQAAALDKVTDNVSFI